MDFVTVIQHLNWPAVFMAALSTFLIGGVWYSIFEKGWMTSNNFTKADLEKRSMPLIFGLSFSLAFVMALNLAIFIGKEDCMFGLIAGFMTGFGWVALSIGIISLFENRSLKYVLINGRYMVLAFTVMGAIIGAWK